MISLRDLLRNVKDSEGNLYIDENENVDEWIESYNQTVVNNEYINSNKQIEAVRKQAENPRTVKSITEAVELVRSLGILNKDIENTHLKLTAQISGNSLKKMESQKATEKSINPRLHALAIANVDRLFVSAIMDFVHSDSHGRHEVEQVRRLGSIMFDPQTGNYIPVMLTAIEYRKQGRKLYSIEAVNVIKYQNNPAGQSADYVENVNQAPIAEFVQRIANLAQSVNNASKNVDENGEPFQSVLSKSENESYNQTTDNDYSEFSIKNFKKAFDVNNVLPDGKERLYVRICDIRNTLNWPREVFDNMLKYLRDKRIITLHLLELVGMTEKNVEDSFIDENNFQMGTVRWNVGHDEAKINEIDNELNKLIYGETPTNVNSDESFESEESSEESELDESPEEISENEIVEDEADDSLDDVTDTDTEENIIEENDNNEINEPENIEPQNSNENPVASGEGNGSSEATHSEPMLTRPEEGAGISDKILTSNGEIINARTSWPKNSSSVDTQSLVEFFNTANESSGFHELAHHVFRVLTDAVQLENSSDLLIEDVNKIFKNAGVKYDDFVNNIGNSRETAHEYFAKSFEAYLFEGKAPVQKLQSTFDRMKQWLVENYHDIQKISGIELNDEMRDIFDRLLASPEQAAEQKNISEINSLYEAGENELQKLQELINQLEEQLRISNEQWEEIADQAFIKGKNKGEDYGIKEGRNYQKEIDKKKNKEKNNLRIEKLKQNFKLIQERQKERRNIREKYKKLVKEINRMSEAKNIHWNRLQQIKNLLSTYDNLNQKNYSLKEMQDIHSAVSSNSGKI